MWSITKYKFVSLLKAKKFPLVTRHNRVKFGPKLKSGSGVRTSKLIVTTLLYMRKQAVKHPLISIIVALYTISSVSYILE